MGGRQPRTYIREACKHFQTGPSPFRNGEIIGKSYKKCLENYCDVLAIFMVIFIMEKKAQKLWGSLLRHFELITFGFAYGRTHKPSFL